MKKTALSLLLGCGVLLASCSSDEPTPSPNPTPDPDTPGDVTATMRPMSVSSAEKQIIANQDKISFEMLSSALKSNEENFAISPVSLFTCLSMLANGADDATIAQFTTAFGASDLNALNTFSGRILEELPQTESDVTMTMGNALFHSPSSRFSSTFSEAMKSLYNAPTTSFSNVAEVESWMKKATDGLIPSLPDEARQSPFYIMNAIYLKSGWFTEFNKENTKKATFTSDKGVAAEVEMMHRNEAASVKTTDKYDALKLDLGELGQFEMVIVRPLEGASLSTFDTSLLAEAVAPAGWSFYITQIGLPKFAAKTSMQKSAFKGTALEEVMLHSGNFSKIIDGDSYSNMQLLGQTVLEVDEKGLTGASCTSNYLVLSPGNEISKYDFVCDRPFFYIIRDKNTGATIFAGYISSL